MAQLTEIKQSICRDLNASSGVVASQDTKASQHKEIEERKRIAQYVTLQSREIEALKMELIMLKRKEAPQMMPYAPTAPVSMSQTMPLPQSNQGSNGSMLPPIGPKK